MKTFREFLVQEEYLFNLKNVAGKDSGSGVYKNPSSSDLGKLRKSMAKGDTEVRFMADSKTKSVFVWDAAGHIHSQAAKDLVANKAIDTPNYFDVTRFFNGTAELSGGSLTYKHSDTIDGLMKHLSSKSKPAGMDQKTYDSVKSLAATVKNGAGALASIFSFVDRYIDGATEMFGKIK
jgi:hypothetical protein